MDEYMNGFVGVHFPLQWKVKRIPASICSIQSLFYNIILSSIRTLLDAVFTQHFDQWQ